MKMPCREDGGQRWGDFHAIRLEIYPSAPGSPVAGADLAGALREKESHIGPGGTIRGRVPAKRPWHGCCLSAYFDENNQLEPAWLFWLRTTHPMAGYAKPTVFGREEKYDHGKRGRSPFRNWQRGEATSFRGGAC